MKLNLASGGQEMEGLVNLDRLTGWNFEDGFPGREDGSVHGVTEAHGLAYLPESEWPGLFAEVYRVLKVGGVFRITEDDTANRKSSRYGGYPGTITLTSPEQTLAHLRAAGFQASLTGPYESADPELVQVSHGLAPKVYFAEGIK